jgi:hypothetical protein
MLGSSIESTKRSVAGAHSRLGISIVVVDTKEWQHGALHVDSRLSPA